MLCKSVILLSSVRHMENNKGACTDLWGTPALRLYSHGDILFTVTVSYMHGEIYCRAVPLMPNYLHKCVRKRSCTIVSKAEAHLGCQHGQLGFDLGPCERSFCTFSRYISVLLLGYSLTERVSEDSSLSMMVESADQALSIRMKGLTLADNRFKSYLLNDTYTCICKVHINTCAIALYKSINIILLFVDQSDGGYLCHIPPFPPKEGACLTCSS